MLAKKITPDDVEAEIAATRWHTDGTLTICVVECHNGFKAVGFSNCVNPNDYDKDKGEAASRDKALEQVYIGMSFHRRQAARDLGRSPPLFSWSEPERANMEGMVWSSPSEAL